MYVCMYVTLLSKLRYLGTSTYVRTPFERRKKAGERKGREKKSPGFGKPSDWLMWVALTSVSYILYQYNDAT